MRGNACLRTLSCLTPKEKAKHNNEHRYIQLAPARYIVNLFAICWIVMATTVCIFAWTIIVKLDALGAHPAVADQPHDEGGPVTDLDKISVILQFIIWVFVTIVLFSTFGLFASVYGHHIPMFIYSIFVAFGTVVVLTCFCYIIFMGFTDQMGNLSSFKNGRLRLFSQNRAIQFWNVLKHMDDDKGNKYTKTIEDHYQCCGWYNAMDYCTVNHMSTIMHEVFNTDLSKYFHSPDDSSAYSDLEPTNYEELQYYYSGDSEDGVEERLTGDNELDNQCLIDYANGNERCLCKFLDESEIVYDPIFLTCFIQNGSKITVDKVCGGDICWLNGCGDEVMRYIKKSIVPGIGVFLLTYVILYFFACRYTLQLTYEYWKMSDLTNAPIAGVRRRSLANYGRKRTNTFRSFRKEKEKSVTETTA